MLKMSFYDETLNKDRLRKFTEETEKEIKYTHELRFRSPDYSQQAKMKIENKLALVWRNDETNLAFPLDKVNTDLYKKLSEIFGRPIGRIEPFINLEKYSRPKC